MCQKSEVRVAPLGTPKSGAGAWYKVKATLSNFILLVLLLSTASHRENLWRNCRLGVTACLALKSRVCLKTHVKGNSLVNFQQLGRFNHRKGLQPAWPPASSLPARLFTTSFSRLAYSLCPKNYPEPALLISIDPNKCHCGRSTSDLQTHLFPRKATKFKSRESGLNVKSGTNGKAEVNHKTSGKRVCTYVGAAGQIESNPGQSELLRIKLVMDGNRNGQEMAIAPQLSFLTKQWNTLLRTPFSPIRCRHWWFHSHLLVSPST